MKKWIKWIAITVAALVALAGAGLVAGTQLAERKMQRKLDVQVAAVPVRTDAEALAHGRYFYLSRGCTDCHGTNGAGRVFVNEGSMRIGGANITPAPGSAVAAYVTQDWVRAIRHGVNPQGRPLMIMPSQDYNRLTDEDLGALIGYLQSMAPVANGGTVLDLPIPVRALYGFGMMRDAAETIDHALAPAKPVPVGETPEHGAYVANICLSCHGAKLNGGRIPGSPPDWPAAANLTPGEGTAMVRYPDADSFMRLFRSGKRPDGTSIKVMPFESLREINDTDLRALYLYLQGLAPQAHG